MTVHATTQSDDYAGDWAVRLLQARAARRWPELRNTGFAIRLPGGRTLTIGDRAEATIVVVRRSGVLALASMDGTRIGEAYRSGALDLEGDPRAILSLREHFADRHPLTSWWRFMRPRLFGQTRSDAEWISQHYDHDAGFYLAFLDRDHRCYSHGFFERDDEPLETAIRRKLDFAIEAVGARPGNRVLDIGTGWGAFTEHAGRRGIRVTGLTISKASELFVQSLIGEQHLPCEVRREHLFDHRSDQPYDAIVNLGVTEHLPDYRRTLAKYLELLKPGGRVYLDASASRIRYDLSAFLLRYIYPGNGSLLSLSEYLAELARTPLEVLQIQNDRHSYALTALHWARNLDAHAEEVVRRWGAPLYRTFRLFLWGCADGFARDLLQAYHLVLERPVRHA